VFTSPTLVDHLLLVVRVAAGLLLIGASAQILLGAFGGSGLRGFSRRAELLGLPWPLFVALSAGLSAFVSGIGLVVGGVASVTALAVVVFTLAATALARPSHARGASFAERLMCVVALLCVADAQGPVHRGSAASEIRRYSYPGSIVSMDAGW
jgi:uncharacterized membrane protein YphA (DoxX/SURF4 family)